MIKTFKYRLLGNREVLENATVWLELCRNLYNAGLEQRISAYKQSRRNITRYDQIKELPELKIAYPGYQVVGSQVLQEVLERLDKAYVNFFRRVKNGEKAGFPRFKSRDRYDSFTLKQCGWKLDGKYLSLSKIGKFKLRLSRPIEGVVKTITIRRESNNKWYACFSCSNVPEKKREQSVAQVGLDVGIKSFLVDSTGDRVVSPKYLRQSEGLLLRRHRRLSRRVKGSKHRRDARVLVAKTYERIRNQRNDFLHKVANLYIERYGTIFVEDLNIIGLIRNSHLSKSISDSSWGKFFELLSYKAEDAGRIVVKVPPRNTSQICSYCGEKVVKSLAVRIHSCPYCGLVMDRDENAARNILRVGQTRQALTKEVALCVA